MKIIVTGGDSGVGKATASALAAAGHSVIIACSVIPRAQRAAGEMAGDVEVRHLNLADLRSVRAFADSVETVDVLINSAGVLGLPFALTVDGFEAHIGTNHLGHFALTCLLGDRITNRVISVVCGLYVFGRLDLDDLNFRARPYSPWAAYTQSKLANLLLVQELTDRGVRAYAVNPGTADTEITRDGTGALAWLGEHKQTPTERARGSVEAVTTKLPGGTYLAPRFGRWGKPHPARLPKMARNPVLARRLWDRSAELTGCDWPGRRPASGTGNEIAAQAEPPSHESRSPLRSFAPPVDATSHRAPPAWVHRAAL